jgi:hypothetical protein
MEEDEHTELEIPIISKNIKLNSLEISYIMERLQWSINWAPEENTQREIDLTTSIINKLIN